ncbi:MAG: hypothetical protein ABSA47_19010, partial [Verrucomicrobiota bacterium]
MPEGVGKVALRLRKWLAVKDLRNGTGHFSDGSGNVSLSPHNLITRACCRDVDVQGTGPYSEISSDLRVHLTRQQDSLSTSTG